MKKKLHALLCTASFLLPAYPAAAQDGSEMYYAGTFTCHDDRYQTDWVMSRDLSGESAVRVFYQEQGSQRVEWIDLAQRNSNDGTVLVDGNGNIRLVISEDDGGFQAAWNAGAPGRDCEPFNVTKTESAKTRFDKLFALLETAAPRAEDAEKAYSELIAPPVVFALPELDQQDYMQHFNELKRTFWERYRAILVEDAANLPLETQADRERYVTMIRRALSDTLIGSVNRGSDREDLMLAIQIASDRLADAGEAMALAHDTGDAKLMCDRLALMKKVGGGGWNLNDLEFVAGLSFDYWSREMADNFIRSAKACGNSEHFVRELTSKWPRIQQRQVRVQEMRQERNRLLALPVTMATLIETENLQPDEEQIKISYRERDMKDRIFGEVLNDRRRELLRVSLGEIKGIAADYDFDEPETAEQMGAACSDLRYLDGLDDEKRSLVRETCETAMTEIARKHATEGLKRIETAFGEAVPLTQSAEAAKELCSDIYRSGLSSGTMRPLYEACQAGESALVAEENEQRCVMAVENSQASDDLLETTITVMGFHPDNRATLRELVCKAAEREMLVSFRSEGILLWSTQIMDIRAPNHPDEVASFKLAEADNESDWKISAWAGEMPRGAGVQISADQFVACVIGTSNC